MYYNFDDEINRESTNCVKFDLRETIFHKKDVLPMWVADMDFKTPDFIIKAIEQRLKHPILGYSFKPDSYYQAIINWYKRHHKWEIKNDWILFSPGVVPALSLIVEAFTQEGDECIVQPPVYFPFFTAIKGNKRLMVENPLKLIKGRYYMDLDDLSKKITAKTKLLILSNPHNPAGIVWKQNELAELAEICIRNNILILSDEIHCDLVFTPNQFTPMARISDEIADITITTNAPSKTFNIAGLSSSSIFITNHLLRNKLKTRLEVTHLHSGNIFGTVALEAAYNYGDNWLNQLLAYLKKNRDFAVDYLKTKIPEVIPIIPEATYLIWLDFRKLKIDSITLEKLLIQEANLGLSNGKDFGTGGEGFMRLNIACTFSKLQKALINLEGAIRAFKRNI